MAQSWPWDSQIAVKKKKKFLHLGLIRYLLKNKLDYHKRKFELFLFTLIIDLVIDLPVFAIILKLYFACQMLKRSLRLLRRYAYAFSLEK